MVKVTFDTPVLKVESLKTKFDTSVLSNSFVALLDNNYIEARILQQLHYWCYSEYGVVIDGIRWIYKPIREWLSEALVGLTEWKLRAAIASLLGKGLIRREKLFTKHQIQLGDRFWWQPKNQTYYYSLNYDRLQELIEQVENKENAEARPAHGEETSPSFLAETIENVWTSQAFEETSNDVSFRFENSTELSIEDFQDTKYCDCPQNNTKNTSRENISKDKSHPTLPCVCEELEINNQEKEQFSNRSLDSSKKLKQAQVNSLDSKVTLQDISSENVEENLKSNKCTDKAVVQEAVQKPNNVQENVQEAAETKSLVKPKLKTPKGTKSKRKDKAPWKDEGQFKRFYRALIQTLPIVANAHSPQGLAQVIIRQLRCGIPHSYWDDFIKGLPIGTSTKPEWEIEPGVPYPMFIEYLTEKIKRGDNTQSDEQTRNEVFRILDKPRQAKAFWGQFKRSVVNVSEQVERARALGVSNPSTPVWTRERIEPSIKEAATAGEKIMAVNSAVGTAIEAAINPQLESVEPSPNQLSEPPIPDPWADKSDNCRDSDSRSEKTTSACAVRSDENCQESPPTMRELLEERLGERHLKGFVKQMPKVSPSEVSAASRAEAKPKTNINQMAIAEINDYLSDPIFRKQITPQLMRSDYELITDELGQIIAVESPPKIEE